MVDISVLMTVIAVLCAVLALVMLFARDAITVALALLGILIGTAALYGLQGEHFVATIQLVVYAGAIMVLFVFSVMLLRIRGGVMDFHPGSPRFIAAAVSALTLVAAGTWVFLREVPTQQLGPWNEQAMNALGGNTRVLAHALFTQHYLAFEAVSLALLVALVGAVTLAKRKFN